MCDAFLGLSERPLWVSTYGQSITNSLFTDHMIDNNHVPNWKEASIITKEDDWKRRTIKEAIWIRRHKGNMNRDEGGYKLSRVYDNIIHKTRASPRTTKGGPEPTHCAAHPGDVTSRDS